MFLERGFEFTHEAVRDWEYVSHPLLPSNYAPSVAAKPVNRGIATKPVCQAQRQMVISTGDRPDGQLGRFSCSPKHRDMASAKCFFSQAKEVVGHKPTRRRTAPTDMIPIHGQYAGYWGEK